MMEKINPVLKNMTVMQITEGYIKTGIACVVNDGKRIKFIDDRRK